MFSSLIESAKVRLFQMTDAHWSFEQIKVIYKTFRLSNEEKLFVTKRISPNSFSVWECTYIQHNNENALCYLT
jgi:hypothetical protein